MSIQKLGNYIRQVDTRNTEKKVSLLLGVSIEKQFIESIANTIGTDMSTYKIVRKGQFAYGPVTSRNGDKVSIALLEQEECIISSSYTVFEITDTEVLLPQYLMLWFRRPEFDRYARFHSHGSAREIFDWDELCNVLLPVPAIDEQKAIVKRYADIEHRITLKRKINDNLEATAQAIYNKMFVEDVDKSNLPTDWRISALGDIAELSAGGDKPMIFSEIKTEICSVPIFSNGLEDDGLYGFTNNPKIIDESVTVSARGTVGYVFLREEPYVPIVRLISVVPNKQFVNAKYLYFALRELDLQSTGTSQQQITVPDYKKNLILVPNQSTLEEFTSKIEPIFVLHKQNKCEIESLTMLKTNCLALLSR